MRFLILGRGKTGSLVAEVARQRGSDVRVAGSAENAACAALTAEKLADIDVVIDFTAPSCVIRHIEACVSAGKNMVVGTTGVHGEMDLIRKLGASPGPGFVYAANFSIGVNLFLAVPPPAPPPFPHH